MVSRRSPRAPARECARRRRRRNAARSAPDAAGRRPRPCCPSACAASRGNNPRVEEKLSSMARRSRRSWKVLESRSPEPSSSRLATMLPTPGLPAGSCAAPPPKAYSIAISGTVASCTNQASMPPGEISRWIFAAACDGVDASDSQRDAGDQAECNALRAESGNRSRALLLAFRRGILDQIAGHRTLSCRAIFARRRGPVRR